MKHVRIITDIGINSNRDLNIAKHLAWITKQSGADYVKLQKRNPDLCYSPEELAKPCNSPWGTTVRAKVFGREFSWDEIAEFAAYCDQIGIEWSASCFDLDSLWELHKRYPKRPFNKIASSMALRKEFVQEVAKQGVFTLISAALCDNDQIDEIVEIFVEAKCRWVLNHCCPKYPAPPERLNLRVIGNFITKYCWKPYFAGVGWSGHETGVLPSVLAAYLGCTFVERHITHDRAAYGADQAASLEERGLQILVRDIRSIELILGDGIRMFYGDEKNPVTFWKRPDEKAI